MISENKSLEKLIKIQENLAKKIILKNDLKEIKLIAGFDLAFSKNKIFCCGVILNRELELIEKKFSEEVENFPYIPGFLAFREGPIIIKTYKKLKSKPDIIFIDGHGIAHPKFFGIASHIGLLLDKPTIGVAKNKLIGEYEEPKNVWEEEKLLFKNKHVGWVLKTKKDCKPIFISPGHKISLEKSLELTKKCLKGFKLPEPLRLSHLEVNKFKDLSLKI